MDLDQIDDLLDALDQTRSEGEDTRFDQAAVDAWFAANGPEMLAAMRRDRAELERVRADLDEERAHLGRSRHDVLMLLARAEKAEAKLVKAVAFAESVAAPISAKDTTPIGATADAWLKATRDARALLRELGEDGEEVGR
jgi:hypothetical protein